MESLSPSEAVRTLFEQYGDEVYRYIRYTVGNKFQADDIVQEVFLRVMQSWHRFQHRSSTKTWVWAIATNCIRDYYREQKRTSSHVELDDEMPAATRDPTWSMQLEESMQSLSFQQKQVFVQRIIQESSTAETARSLGWSEAKVKTTLHRAMKKVRKWFEAGGGRI